MEGDTPTPDAGLEPADETTPEPPEQGDGTGSAAPSDTPAAEPDRRLAQAEFTRASQAFSDLKAELGLDKAATRAEVIAAVKALREAPPADDEDEDGEPELPPEVLERIRQTEERAWNAELRAVQAVYGEDFTKQGLELVNFLRTNDDPQELLVALRGFNDAWGTPPDGAAVDETGEAEDETPGAPVGLSEGGTGPSARQAISASAGRREPGTVSAVRGIFEGLGIGSRPRES